MTCTCARLKIGMTVTEHRNWNPDCPEHGVESAWWKSPDQVAKRQVEDTKLREQQRLAREARQRARGELS